MLGPWKARLYAVTTMDALKCQNQMIERYCKYISILGHKL
jgi:hypothetical protein